jgi:hypothetical protein
MPHKGVYKKDMAKFTNFMAGKGRFGRMIPDANQRKKIMEMFNKGQHGAGWSDFTNFFKKAGNAIASGAKTVYNKALKPAGNAVYNHAIKPGIDYIKDKPFTAISKLSGAAGLLPTPVGGVLKGISGVTGAIGNAIGKGRKRRMRGKGAMKGSDRVRARQVGGSSAGKVLMAF